MDGDTEKLVRVFNNLLSNALKYGKGADKNRNGSGKVGTEAILTVKNNGQMIPKHSLDSLFDRFYRVEESRSHGKLGELDLVLPLLKASLPCMVATFCKIYSRLTSFIIHLPLKRNDLSNTQNYG